MTAAEQPAERIGFGLIAVLCVVVIGLSTAANWSRLTGSKALFHYLPPYREYDANMVDHLGGEYLSIAKSIAAGEGFSSPFHDPSGPTTWMPPLYPLLLAALLRIYDGDIPTTAAYIVLLQNLSLILTGWVVMDATRRTTRLPHGPALSLMIYLGLVVYHFQSSFQFTHDSWLVLLALDLLLLAASRLAEAAPSAKEAAGWGVLGGLAALVNPVLGLVWAAATGRQALADRRARTVAVAVLAAGATLLPWTVRNYLTFHRLIPVKSNLYFELYQSAVVEPDGVLRDDTWRTHPFRGTGLRERALYRAKGEMAYLDDYRRRFLRYLRDNPDGFLGKVANRFLAATFLYHPFNRTERGFPLWVSYLVHPLPFNALLIVCLIGCRPWAAPKQLAVLAYVVYLIPYVVVGYYERYAFPLVGVQAMVCYWAVEALVVSREGRGGSCPPGDERSSGSDDQNASVETASPPPIDPSALQTPGATAALTERTEPSPSSTLTAGP